MSNDKKESKFAYEQRSFNRFDIKKNSIALELILENYKRIPAISMVNNISLGGMGILVKESLNINQNIKFHIGNSKTVFHGVIVWSKESGLETYTKSIGISFVFPHKDEFEAQQKELISFVIKTLNKLSKKHLVDRLMDLFIERRRVFDAAKSHIQEATEAIEKAKQKSDNLLERAHNIIDYSFTPVLYLNENFEILYTNQAAETVLGYTNSEVNDVKLQNIVSENTKKMIQKHVKTQNTNIYNGVVIKKDGKEIEIVWRIVPHLIAENNTISFLFSRKA